MRLTKIEWLKSIDSFVGQSLVYFFPKAKLAGLNSIEAILVIRPGGIGDAILLIPTLQALQKVYPDARMTVLAERRNAGAFSVSGLDLNVLRYDAPKELLLALARRYDVVIDSEQWYRLSAVVARLARAAVRIGFATNQRKRLFNCPVNYSQSDYEVDSFLHLLRPLGIDSPTVSAPYLSSPDDFAPAEDLRRRFSTGYVVLFPGASIPERRWPPANFRNLAEQLRTAGCNVVVVGGKEDVGAGDIIEKTGDVNLAGKTTLAGTAAVIANARLLICGDSGLLHLAAGLGVPTVALFGPGILIKWAPRGKQHQVVSLQLDCSPCTCWGQTPPCPDQGRCIADIPVDTVYAAARQILFPE